MRVLLVDDEEELVVTLAERLSLRDIDADWALSGEEALKMAAANIRAFHEHQVHKNFVMNDTPGIVLGQKAHQCAVALPVGGNDLAGRHLSVFDFVELELCRVAEVLEYHTVFIRNCDLHGGCLLFSFLLL